MSLNKKILFLTGTRADFGKLKPLMFQLSSENMFDLHVFVTGMHMLLKYGYTCEEVERTGFKNIYKYINQNPNDGMDHVLAKTISGLSDYVRETKPDLIIVHGDRVEALAGATVGALNNILVGHIEGGEVSGTIDELIRHAVTKLSHIHFVSNSMARQRLIQLGEDSDTIHIIGSPDIDVMNSDKLPDITEVKQHYDIGFENYSILLFHPITTELDTLQMQINILIESLIKTDRNYVVIYPNNDNGTDIILNEYRKISGNKRFRFFPSMRFEYFLSLLKNADFMIGNSSAGVREAPHFGVPAINLGSRQNNRVHSKLVLNSRMHVGEIIEAVNGVMCLPREKECIFGDGNSAALFKQIVCQQSMWKLSGQKFFIDQ